MGVLKVGRKSDKWALKAIVVFLLALFLNAEGAEAGLREQVFETRLSNGLKVILLENHKAPVVTFQVWYRAGSRSEQWGKTGLAHVLEHMMFKGTEKISARDFTRIIEENGGEYNAFTSQDFAGYFETLSADRIQVAIDLESDRMLNLVLREEDFLTERMVVMEERRMRTDDNPRSFLREQVEAAAFQAQPYHWPIIGWMEDLARITLEDVKIFYKTFYNPSNAFIVVVGDFNREDLLPKLEQSFGVLPKGTEPTHYKYNDPPQTGERRIIVEKEAQLPHIIMGYHVPNLSEEDSYALELIAAILSSGKSSRLQMSLMREKRLALEVNAESSPLSIDPGLFQISATLLPGINMADIEKELDQELERLQKEPVGERELEKARNQIEAYFVFAQDSLFFQAMLLAIYEISLGWESIDDYLPSIRKVSPEDIQRVAGLYLTQRKRTVGILSPLARSAGEPTSEGAPPPMEMQGTGRIHDR
jgi:zinc protease